MNKIHNLDRQRIKHFLIVFLINLLALSPLIIFSHVHISEDAYAYLMNNDWAAVEWYVGSFRYFGALVTSLISLTGHNPIVNPSLDIVFYIIISAFVITLLSIYIFKLLKHTNKLFLFVLIEFALLITVTNVWYSNILTFAECIAFDAIGLLFCFLSIYIYSSRNSLISRITASVLFICSAACFQQFIPVFAIYTILILCIKQSQSDKKGIKELLLFYLKPFLFIVINSVLYYLIGIGIQKILNITPNSRASMSLQTVIDNVKYFIKQQHSFFKGRGFFSSEILTVCYLMVFVIFIFSLIMFWRKSRQTAKTIFIGLSFVAAYICAYLPGLVSTSHGTRTICALFSVFALFAIGAVALYQHKITSAILACVLFLVFALNVYKTVNMEVVQIIGNTNESTYADGIAYEIEKFEVSNGVKIKKIGVCYDKTPDINAKEIYHDYDAEAIIYLHIKHPIEFVEVPKDIIQNNFAEKDWTSYDAEEQIVFDKNTAYVCVY